MCGRKIAQGAISRRDEYGHILVIRYIGYQAYARVIRVIENKNDPLAIAGVCEKPEPILPNVMLVTITKGSCPGLKIALDARDGASIYKDDVFVTKYVSSDCRGRRTTHEDLYPLKK